MYHEETSDGSETNMKSTEIASKLTIKIEISNNRSP